MMLTVVRAAIKGVGGSVISMPKPARHDDVIHLMAQSGIPTPIMGEQGFLLSDGTFASREAAYSVAKEAGQLNQEALERGLDHLFSEDVW